MTITAEQWAFNTKYREATKQLQHTEDPSIIVVCRPIEDNLMYICVFVLRKHTLGYFLFVGRREPNITDVQLSQRQSRWGPDFLKNFDIERFMFPNEEGV